MARHVIVSETPPAAAPEFVGQHYIETPPAAEPKHYLANGTAAVGDWQEVGAAGGTPDAPKTAQQEVVTDASPATITVAPGVSVLDLVLDNTAGSSNARTITVELTDQALLPAGTIYPLTITVRVLAASQVRYLALALSGTVAHGPETAKIIGNTMRLEAADNLVINAEFVVDGDQWLATGWFLTTSNASTDPLKPVGPAVKEAPTVGDPAMPEIVSLNEPAVITMPDKEWVTITLDGEGANKTLSLDIWSLLGGGDFVKMTIFIVQTDATARNVAAQFTDNNGVAQPMRVDSGGLDVHSAQIPLAANEWLRVEVNHIPFSGQNVYLYRAHRF